MDKNIFVREALETLDKIRSNVKISGFMLADDALNLISVAEKTIENYSINYSELNDEYIKNLSNKDIQTLLYNICRIRYPELEDLWFKIDNYDTMIDVTYRNKCY